jgi:hypothetical protein
MSGLRPSTIDAAVGGELQARQGEVARHGHRHGRVRAKISLRRKIDESDSRFVRRNEISLLAAVDRAGGFTTPQPGDPWCVKSTKVARFQCDVIGEEGRILERSKLGFRCAPSRELNSRNA